MHTVLNELYQDPDWWLRYSEAGAFTCKHIAHMCVRAKFDAVLRRIVIINADIY